METLDSSAKQKIYFAVAKLEYRTSSREKALLLQGGTNDGEPGNWFNTLMMQMTRIKFASAKGNSLWMRPTPKPSATLANFIPRQRSFLRRQETGGNMKVLFHPAAFLVTAIVYVSRLLFLVAAALLYLYFLPSLIAENRNPGKMEPIFILNLVAGWMVLPWLVALALARRMDPVPRTSA